MDYYEESTSEIITRLRQQFAGLLAVLDSSTELDDNQIAYSSSQLAHSFKRKAFPGNTNFILGLMSEIDLKIQSLEQRLSKLRATKKPKYAHDFSLAAA